MYYSHLEEYIIEFYRSIGITKPEQLKCADIAQNAGINLHSSNFILRDYT